MRVLGFTVTDGGKAVINDAALTERTASVFKTTFGPMAVGLTTPLTVSEDYSEFILGGSDPARVAAARGKGEVLPTDHSPFFAPVPEPTIRTGVETMTLAVLNCMRP